MVENDYEKNREKRKMRLEQATNIWEKQILRQKVATTAF